MTERSAWPSTRTSPRTMPSSDGLAPEGVTFGIHMCRGNNRSRWFAEGGYDRIAEKAFGELRYDRFLLEYDSERAGGFALLRFVPNGKTVVLGLISTKVPRREAQDDLLRRIDEAAKYVPVASFALSPQCGFASVAAGNEISWDDQRRKLELLVDTARKVWPGYRKRCGASRRLLREAV